MPVAFSVFLLVLMVFLVATSPCCTATVLIGIEYLQLIYLLGIVHVPWADILKQAFRILSIFSLDIDAAVPLQCYLGVPPQLNHVLVLMLPVLLFMVPYLLLRIYQATGRTTEAYTKLRLQRVKYWLAIGTFIGCGKLLFTSFEAIGCSTLQDEDFIDNEIDWFCISSNNVTGSLVSLVGVTGFLGYGVAFPWWFIQSLSTTHQVDRNNESQASHEFTTAITDINHWTKFFLRPFQAKSWWWSGFLLGRKCVLVVIIFILQDEPFLTLTFVMVLLMISEAIQQRKSPIWHNHDESEGLTPKHDGEASPPRRRIWKLSTIDLVLHCCLMFAITLGMFFLAIPEESGLVRFAMTITFFAVMGGSLTYLILAFCCCLCLGCRIPLPHDDMENVEHSIGEAGLHHQRISPLRTSSEVSVQADTPSDRALDRQHDADSETQNVSVLPRNGSTEDRENSSEMEESDVESFCDEDPIDPAAIRRRMFDELINGWQSRSTSFDSSIPTDGSSLERPPGTGTKFEGSYPPPKPIMKYNQARQQRYPEADNDPATAKPTNTRLSIIDTIGNSSSDDGTGKSSHYIFADDEDEDSTQSGTTDQSHSYQKSTNSTRTYGSSSIKDDYSSSNASSSLNLLDGNTGFPVSESSYAHNRMYVSAANFTRSTNTTGSINSSNSSRLAISSMGTSQSKTSINLSTTGSVNKTRKFEVSSNNKNDDDGNNNRHHRMPSTSSSTSTMVLRPYHRVEPAVWGKRHANVYQPQVGTTRNHKR